MTDLRREVEDFLFHEAGLLDAWKLDDWFALFVEGGCYYVPPTDRPEASHHDALFVIADDLHRAATQNITRTNENWIPHVFGNFTGAFQCRRGVARRLSNTELSTDL